MSSVDELSATRSGPLIEAELVVLGPFVPELDAYLACRLLKSNNPEVRILLFHRDATDNLVQADALAVGANACLPGASSCEHCMHTLATILLGYPTSTCYPPGLHAIAALAVTPREQQVLQYMATQLSYPEIAREVGISVVTVRNVAQRTIEKFGVHHRSEAVRRALRRGIIEPTGQLRYGASLLSSMDDPTSVTPHLLPRTVPDLQAPQTTVHS